MTQYYVFQNHYKEKSSSFLKTPLSKGMNDVDYSYKPNQTIFINRYVNVKFIALG